MQHRGLIRAVMLALFFLSGISGLVYQLVWTRMLVLVFGNTLLATSTVLSSFMAGLAIGSYFFGRYIDQQPRQLIKIYGYLEIGIGLYALAFPWLLKAAEPFYMWLYAGAEGNMVLLNLVRFSICFVLIAIPTAFMGATLPVLVKRFVQGGHSLGRQVGFLYGLNTAGAVAGCVATGFLLLRTLGMQKTTMVAVAINVGVGLIALLLARKEPVGEAEETPVESVTASSTEGPLYDTWTIRMVLVAIGISGFCALAYEVLWARMLNLFLQNNVYSFTLVIATFLLGIAIGSLLYSNLLSRLENRIALFVLLEVGIGLYAYATPFIFDWLNQTLFLKQSDALTMAKTSIIMIAPTILMGIAVPLAMQICQRGPHREGSSVGTVYAVNTVGSILGAFVAGFVLIPTVGLHRGLIAMASLNVLAGLLVLLPSAPRQRRPVWVGGFVVGIVLLFVLAPPTLFLNLYDKAQPNAEILHYKEGKIANVVVYDFFKAGYKDLFLNRVEEASSRLWHVQLFKMLGIMPVMMHEAPDDALMVAFGAGMAAGACANQVSSLDCVDLNPDIEEVAEVFTHENLDVINNPKLNKIVNDGRNALLLSSRRYSLIISDATNPKMFDSWTLYTREFYELVQSRLKPGGVFCQWVLIPLPGDSIKIILKTFQTVFPHSSFWCIYGSSQCMMLGLPERMELDYQELSERLEPVLGPSGLAEYGIEDTEKFLSYLWLGEDELEASLEGFDRISTDDLPHAQFQVDRGFEGKRASLDLLEHQATPAAYLTHLGPEPQVIDGEIEAYVSLARRLTLAYLLNNRAEALEAEQVARDMAKGTDQNVASRLGYDRERQRYFETRIGEHPDDANAHNNLGFNYWKQGLFADAVEHLEEAISIKPDFANAYVNLARAFIEAGLYDQAVATLLELRELNPTQATLALVDNQLAIVRSLRRQRYEGPTRELLVDLAEAYRRDGDPVKEAEATRQAAEAGTPDVELLITLAGLYENLEFVDRALETYEKLALLQPGDSRFQAKVAEFRLLKSDRSVRQAWLNSNEIVFREPGSGDGHLESCLAAAELWNEHEFDGSVTRGGLEEAASLYESSLATQPDDMHAYRDLATVYEALGDFDVAAATWRRGLELVPGNPVASAAVQRLEILAALDHEEVPAGQEPLYSKRVGELYLMGGEYERAIPFFERALVVESGDPLTWLSLARAFEGAGQYPESQEAYEQALAREEDASRARQVEKRLEEIRDLVSQAG